MKKLILILLALQLVSCSKSGGGSGSKPNPNNEEFTLEGTVVKVFNLLIPSAHASNFAVLLSTGDDDCDGAERCAFLIDASKPEDKLVDLTPVVNNRFKFKLTKPLSSDGIYKVIVRGWNPETKQPVYDSNFRELTFKGSEAQGRVEVTPETSLIAKRKLEILKTTPNDFQAIENFATFVYNRIFNLIKQGVETLRQSLLRFIQQVDGDPSELLVKMASGAKLEEVEAEIILQNLRKDHWTESKVSQSSLAEILDFYQRVISGKVKVQVALDDIMEKENIRRLEDLVDIENFLESDGEIENLTMSIENKQAELLTIEDEEIKLERSNEILELQDLLEQREQVLMSLKREKQDKCSDFNEYNLVYEVYKELDMFKSYIDLYSTNYESIFNQLNDIANQDIPQGDLLDFEELMDYKNFCGIQGDVR